MNIFEIIANVQKASESKWIYELDDTMIQPVMINNFLKMNNELIHYTKYLDRFTFTLSPKSWLHLAWSVIPKRQYKRYPYIKPLEEDESLKPIIEKLRKHLACGDNDWEECKKYYLNHIKDNKEEWYRMFGMNKKEWKTAGIDYTKIKEGEERVDNSPKGLSCFM